MSNERFQAIPVIQDFVDAETTKQRLMSMIIPENEISLNMVGRQNYTTKAGREVKPTFKEQHLVIDKTPIFQNSGPESSDSVSLSDKGSDFKPARK